MENVTHALYMAFAVFVFIIAFSYTMYMVNSLNTTSKTLMYTLDETNHYDSLILDDLISNNEDVDNKVSKIVGIDAIIPTLYRYNKESFAVKILDEDGELLQMFDTTIEGKVRDATQSIKEDTNIVLTTEQKNEYNALLSLYGASNACNMFGAPWLGSTNKDAKARIDMYITGQAGYIKNTWVNYKENNLNQYKDRKFKETFIQYAYEGDTVTESTYEDGEVTDELISLTGTKQISTKIVITYQLIP